nr:hypothetical protein [Planococcus glaciei]
MPIDSISTRKPSRKKAALRRNRPAWSLRFCSCSKKKPLVLVSLGAMGLSGSQLILNTYIVLFAYESLGIPLVLAGMLLVISEVSGSFGRVAWGMISDSIFQGSGSLCL